MNLFDYTYNLVRQIPEGKISTYGAVARALGDIIASRAVGRMMNQNPDADTMPCYKIVHSDGRLGGFGLGEEDKIRRLRADNIMVKEGKIVDFEHVLYDEFKTEYPLKTLQQEQQTLKKKISTTIEIENLETVAGIDVAYPRDEFEDACGSYILMDYHTKEVVDEHIVYAKTDFPYIPSYFAYRELPIIQKIMEEIDHQPSVLMLDGNGVLHPRGLGLASHVGVHFNIPSIGVAKSLLAGTVQNNYVKIHDEIRGSAVSLSARAKKPIYISSGHKISLEKSLEIVRRLGKSKIPEPLRLAHMHATKELGEQR
jgi:deoxyribonuclease V